MDSMGLGWLGGTIRYLARHNCASLNVVVVVRGSCPELSNWKGEIQTQDSSGFFILTVYRIRYTIHQLIGEIERNVKGKESQR